MDSPEPNVKSSDPTTEPRRTGSSAAAPRETPALVIAWSATEPERVGEVALVAPSGGWWQLGRAHQTEPPPAPQSLLFAPQRPAGLGPTPPAAPPRDPALSRQQLLCLARGDELLVRNVGRCSLRLNGRPVTEARVRSGDTLHLEDQLLLLCAFRPVVLAPLRSYPVERLGAFGGPDAEGQVGESPAAWRLREQLAALARTDLPVLIIGQSGSGKELIARGLHALSHRSARPAVVENVSTLPVTLAAAILFGNRRGFPNPDMEERDGLIGAADGSTLFLDEIGDTPAEIQPMLLRVLETGEYTRLGEAPRLRRSAFRLIAATNRPEHLRPELRRRFARELRVPGLGQRREDIPLLLRQILVRQAERDPLGAARFLASGRVQIDPRLIEQLLHHDYTTHVAEIGTLLGRAIQESYDDTLRPLEGLAPLRDPLPLPDGEQPERRELPSAEQAAAALRAVSGNVTRAAERLGISRDQLNRLIRRANLSVHRAPPNNNEDEAGS